MKKVVVVAGGLSSEKEVSLQTGKGVFEALLTKGYDAHLVQLTEDIPLFVETLKQIKPDVVFNALHGKFGEDGNIQGLLNLMGIPYTHSGVLASSVGMDKHFAKMAFNMAGIPVAPEKIVTLSDIKSGISLPYPYVIKPINEGSSVGVFIIENEQQEQNLIVSWPFGGAKVMMETYIPGREMTVSVINGKAIAITEIAPKTGFYNYENKYLAGMSEHIVPANLPLDAQEKMMQFAQKAHVILGCRGASRTDFRYDDTNPQKPHIVALEINTQPGMTPLSLLPEAAKYAGISYEDLVSLLVEEAACEQ
ncbi:MAG: D-alanine--D-alanine ligase [Alphaproteobacteria bacterium]|nr:D-alanine--D-alanine ligase [Alphaproteobacteria bacterium]